MKERLKRIRLALGLTQQEMAEKLNISVRAYRTYEYVSKGYPSEFIQNLIDVFSVNANYFFTGAGAMFINSDNAVNNKDGEAALLKNAESTGTRLSCLQRKNSCSDRDMAELLGIYEYEYAELKEGRKELSLKLLYRLKKSFQVSIDWLLWGSI